MKLRSGPDIFGVFKSYAVPLVGWELLPRLPRYRCVGSRCEGLNECGGEGDGVVSNGGLEMKILQASTERREFREGQGQVWMMKGLDESSEPLFVNDDIIKP